MSASLLVPFRRTELNISTFSNVRPHKEKMVNFLPVNIPGTLFWSPINSQTLESCFESVISAYQTICIISQQLHWIWSLVVSSKIELMNLWHCHCSEFCSRVWTVLSSGTFSFLFGIWPLISATTSIDDHLQIGRRHWMLMPSLLLLCSFLFMWKAVCSRFNVCIFDNLHLWV